VNPIRALSEEPNWAAEGIDPSAPTPPDMRVRVRRFLAVPKD